MSAEGTPALNDGLAEAMAMTPDPEPAQSDTGGGQPRDELGRFAPTAEERQAEADRAAGNGAQGGDTGDDKQGWLPAWRVREITEERDRQAERAEAAERRAEERDRRLADIERQQREAAKPKREVPDLIADPGAYADYLREETGSVAEQIRKEVRDMRIETTFEDYREQNPEQFQKAWDAIRTAHDPVAVQRVMNAPNPGRALRGWYQQQEALRETGGDLSAYRKKLRDEFKKDPEFRKEFMADLEAEARGGSDTRSNITALPPSLNRAPGGGERQMPGALGNSDAEIFQRLTARR